MHWPSFRRKLPMASKVLFGLAGVLALSSFLVVRSEVERAADAQAATGPRVGVVAAARDLVAGSTLAAADLRSIDVPLVYAPPEAVTSRDDAIGLVLDGPVSAGEVLVRTRLAASAFGPSVSPGNVVVTVAFASVPVGLSTADRVDAFATYAGARPYTTVVGEGLHVLSIAPTDAAFDGPKVDPGHFGRRPRDRAPAVAGSRHRDARSRGTGAGYRNTIRECVAHTGDRA